MAASQPGVFNVQQFTDAGAPAANYRLYTYVQGTTTQKVAYTDAAGSVAHTYTSDGSGGQYIGLNSRGELPAPLFLTAGAYDITLKTPAGATVWTRYAVGVGLPADGYLVDSYGAAGDGSTDDATAINAAITAAAVAGGVVVFGGGKNYKHNSAITLKSGVVLKLNGATLTWGGGAAAQITSASTGVLTEAGIEGGTINGGTTATKIVELRSAYHCHMQDVVLKSNSATVVALDLLVNTSGTTNADGNRNNVFNEFRNLLQDGTCGTGIRMRGDSSVPTVVTLNTFTNFNARGCSVRGIDFASWCDSNYFAGVTRVQMVANSSVGVEWNTDTPASNVGVYSNNFDHLAVDTFGTMTGRIGIKKNWTKLNKIDYYFNDPPAEGGAYSFSANCQSYYVMHQPGLTSNLVLRQKLSSIGGKERPSLDVCTDGEISTENVDINVGTNRTGSGFCTISLVGDTTYTAYGVRLQRENTGANANSVLAHRGTGNLSLRAQDAGQVIVEANGSTRIVANATGLGFFGSAGAAQPTGYGTPTSLSKVVNLPGTASTLGQVGGTLAALIADLKTLGLIGA